MDWAFDRTAFEVAAQALDLHTLLNSGHLRVKKPVLLAGLSWF